MIKQYPKDKLKTGFLETCIEKYERIKNSYFPKETLEYFKRQNVKIKIISGDNPVTVSNLLKQINIEDYDKTQTRHRIESHRTGCTHGFPDCQNGRYGQVLSQTTARTASRQSG